MSGVKDLQRLVLDRLAELGLSYREAAARVPGGRLKHQTLSAIGRGEHSGRIRDETAQAIAVALDCKVSDVRRAAHMSQVQPPTEFRLPARARNLTPAQRRAIIATIDAFLAERRYEEGAM